MTAAVFQDLRKGIISNVLILFGFLGGAVFQLIRLGGSGLILFFGSAVFPVLLFSILYYFRMIGAGDIKLLAALGGFLGISDLFRCLVCALIFGGILSLFSYDLSKKSDPEISVSGRLCVFLYPGKRMAALPPKRGKRRGISALCTNRSERLVLCGGLALKRRSL